MDAKELKPFAYAPQPEVRQMEFGTRRSATICIVQDGAYTVPLYTGDEIARAALPSDAAQAPSGACAACDAGVCSAHRAQPDERAAFDAWMGAPFTAEELSPADLAVGEPHSNGVGEFPGMPFLIWQAGVKWCMGRATAPKTTGPIYQIGGYAGEGTAWWDVTKERYDSEKKAGYMKTGIVYREES